MPQVATPAKNAASGKTYLLIMPQVAKHTYCEKRRKWQNILTNNAASGKTYLLIMPQVATPAKNAASGKTYLLIMPQVAKHMYLLITPQVAKHTY